MKSKVIFFSVLFTLNFLTTKAQKPDSVTGEDMTKYVVMMDSIESWKKLMVETSNKFARGNEKITAARYTKLLPIFNDQKKLTDANATADEIAYLKKAMEMRNENARNFQDVFLSLMTIVGETTYKKVSKAVASDPKVKQRYTDEMSRLKGNAGADQ